MRSSSKKPIINEHIEADAGPPGRSRDRRAAGHRKSIAEASAGAAADSQTRSGANSAPDAEPVVCKIMDYGKHIFDLKKEKAANKKKQRRTQVKEIKFRPGTEVGDYQVKLRNLIRFLEDGDKAKVSLRFRGREMAHQHLGMELVTRIREDLVEYGTVEQEPKMEGRQIVMVLAPVKKR